MGERGKARERDDEEEEDQKTFKTDTNTKHFELRCLDASPEFLKKGGGGGGNHLIPPYTHPGVRRTIPSIHRNPVLVSGDKNDIRRL